MTSRRVVLAPEDAQRRRRLHERVRQQSVDEPSQAAVGSRCALVGGRAGEPAGDDLAIIRHWRRLRRGWRRQRWRGAVAGVVEKGRLTGSPLLTTAACKRDGKQLVKLRVSFQETSAPTETCAQDENSIRYIAAESLIQGSVDLAESITKTASRSVHPFLLRPTDR